MTIAERELIELVLQLPPELRDELRDFATLLLLKQHGTTAQVRTTNTTRTLRQDWAGALAQWNQQYDSVALQHQAAEWMSADALKQANDVSG